MEDIQISLLYQAKHFELQRSFFFYSSAKTKDGRLIVGETT